MTWGRGGRGATPAVLAGLVFLSGCGAAYYGTAIGIIATQKDETETDISFPNAKPTAPVVPGFVELDFGATPDEITVTRSVNGGLPSGGAPTVQVTDFQVVGFTFPPGYGETVSNRDAGITLNNGDRLVVRINGAANEELTFSTPASTGADVAAALQTALRALDGVDPNIANLTVRYEEATGTYVLRTGLPGEDALIEFEPDTSTGGATTNATSTATARRLGLGVANGGIERSGAESVQISVANSGTDALPAGTSITLYLSEDKELDATEDFPIDVIRTNATVAVGEARTFSRRNGNQPPINLVRSDFDRRNYYLLFDVASLGEQLRDDNLTNSQRPVMVYDPVDDPETGAAETADPLDFVPTASNSPISLLLGNQLTTTLSITNFGAAVAAPQPIDIDLVLSADQELDEPAGFFDPAGVLAGVYINPRDPNEPITVDVVDGGVGVPLKVTVNGRTLTVTYDAAGTDTVTALVNALNASAGQRVDCFADDSGDPDTTTIAALLAADGDTSTVATDVFVTSRAVSFPVAEVQTTRSFTVGAPLRTSAISIARLPLKLFPLFRIRPTLTPAPTNPENAANNLRGARNFIRIYDPLTATLDATTGTVLPTVNNDDFAALQAVTQRPVTSGSIRQGQQRVFRFAIPDLGADPDESQLLVILESSDFDPHLDLLTSNGTYIAGSDDSDLGLDAMIYTAVQAPSTNRNFYAVVSSARADESDLTSGDESFELTISVNARGGTDTALVRAVEVGSIARARPLRYETNAPRIVNDVLIPIDLSNSKAEVMFVLPTRARVRFRTQPVFTVGVEAEITGFTAGTGATSPVPFQAVLDESASGLVYKPSGKNIRESHVLPAGVYTVAFDGLNGVGDPQTNLRLELDTEFMPEE